MTLPLSEWNGTRGDERPETCGDPCRLSRRGSFEVRCSMGWLPRLQRDCASLWRYGTGSNQVIAASQLPAMKSNTVAAAMTSALTSPGGMPPSLSDSRRGDGARRRFSAAMGHLKEMIRRS